MWGLALALLPPNSPAQITAPEATDAPVDSEDVDSQDLARYGPAPGILTDPDFDRLLRRADELSARGESEAALTILAAALESRPDPEERAMLTRDPDDPRLFRPARRATLEALREIADEVVPIRRARDGGAAERALREARKHPGASALRDVAERFLLTDAGARALYEAGNRLLDQGDATAALRCYQDLRRLVPDSVVAAAGIDGEALLLRRSAALELVGRDDEARSLFVDIPESHSFRIGGAAVEVGTILRNGVLGSPADDSRPDSGAGAVSVATFATDEPWALLWEFRFTESKPYRIAQPGGNDRIRILPRTSEEEGAGVDLLPFLDHIPGTRLTLDDEGLSVLDHHRPMTFGRRTGRRLAIGDGETEPPRPMPGVVRNRIPILDFDGAHMVRSEGQFHTTLTEAGDARGTPRSRIHSYEARSLRATWNSADDPSTADLSFLAAPVLHRGLLIAPFQQGELVGIAALDAATGALRWRTVLHSGGTFYRRPPTPELTVDHGTVLVVTNAGVAAAVEADSGSLIWLRRYERAHPSRPSRPNAAIQSDPWPSALRVARHRALLGFVPTPPIRFENLVLIAPSDGDLLLALDAVDGAVVWLLPREVTGSVASRRYTLQLPLGVDDGRLLVAGPDELVAIDARTGIRLWRDQVPGGWVRQQWRGRGLCIDGHVLLPGDDKVLVRRIDASLGEWTQTELPPSPPELEPFEGPFNLFWQDDTLAVAFQSGVQVLTKTSALIASAEAATDPTERIQRWLQADRPSSALEELLRLRSTNGWAEPEAELAVRLLGEVARSKTREGRSDEAFALIDDVSSSLEPSLLADRLVVLRAELHRELGDLETFQNLMAELRDRRRETNG